MKKNVVLRCGVILLAVSLLIFGSLIIGSCEDGNSIILQQFYKQQNGAYITWLKGEIAQLNNHPGNSPSNPYDLIAPTYSQLPIDLSDGFSLWASLLNQLPAGKYIRLNLKNVTVASTVFAGRDNEGYFGGSYGYPASDYIVEIVLPNAITEFGDEAFSVNNFAGLRKINTPPGLRKIGNLAFSGSSITEFYIPQNYDTNIGPQYDPSGYQYNFQSMGWGVFFDCKNLTDLYLWFDPQAIYWDEYYWEWADNTSGAYNGYVGQALMDNLGYSSGAEAVGKDMFYADRTWYYDWGQVNRHGLIKIANQLTIHVPQDLVAYYQAQITDPAFTNVFVGEVP